MNPGKLPPSTPLGVYRKSDLNRSEPSFRASVVRQVLMTREVRELLGALIPDVLSVWADRSLFKTMISRAVGKSLQQSFASPEILRESGDLQQLFENPELIERIADQLPVIFQGFSRALSNALQTVESISAENKKAILKDLVSGIADGGSGEMITRSARIINDIHQSDPEFFTRLLAPGFSKWVESIDFGEVREALENSGPDVRAFIRMTNDIIWQYPSKVVVALSMLPLLINLIAESLDISVEKLNTLPPDLLTDVICGLIRDIDGPAVSGLVNELSEMARKVHTGSALLGDAGNPEIYKTLSKKLDAIMARTDPAALWKARIMINGLKDQVNQAIFDAGTGNDEFIRLALEKSPALANIRMRAFNRRLTLLESLDEEMVSDSLARSLSEYDIQEPAEILNNMLRLLNRLYDSRPEAASAFIRQFADALDLDALSDAARNLLGDSREELRPAARAIVPGLVNWVCDILKPEDDEFEDEAALARDALANLFTPMEA